MTKRPSLATGSTLASRLQPKAGQSVSQEAPAAAEQKVDRDYKTVMMRINRAGWAELSHLSVEMDRALEDMMIEAANEFLTKHGKPPVIEKRQPPKG